MQRMILVVVGIWVALGVGVFPARAAEELILCGWDEVFILEKQGQTFSTNKVWSWKAADQSDLPATLRDKFRTTDDCKPVNGGARILISSSGGGVALADRATKKTLFSGFVGNAHSVEMLPQDRIAVAGSRHAQGNRVAIFEVAQPGKILHSIPLDSGHGVVWDETRKVLWALGYETLLELRLKNWETSKPELEVVREHKIPGRSGHDLMAVPGTKDLLLTTHPNVFLFDRETAAFRVHPELNGKRDVKSVSIHPQTRQMVYIGAEGTNWWSGGFIFLNPMGEMRLPNERLYKARWNATAP